MSASITRTDNSELFRLKQSAKAEQNEKIFYLKTQAIVVLAFAALLVLFGILGYAKTIALEAPLSHVSFFSGMAIGCVTIWTGRRVERAIPTI